MQERSARVAASLGALICVAALALQLGLVLARVHERGGGTLEGLWRFLGFFTNLTNAFAAIVLIHAALRPKARTWLGAPSVEASATLAIVMAGFLNFALLGRFNPQGLFRVADIALHEIAPLAVAAFWILRPHGGLRLRHAAFTLAWPLVYCVYALLRGSADGWYPYYFLDPMMLGLGGLLTNILALGVAFLGVALGLVAIDRALARAQLSAVRPANAFAGIDEAEGAD
jgi:hypothetical protein